MLSISIVHDDVLERPSDLLILKYADGLYGVDQAVAARIGFDDHIQVGNFAVIAGRGIKPKQVLFLGVGELHAFRYAEIRNFGRDVLKVAARLDEPPSTITMTIHGPGYGLDEGEAFLSLVGGLMESVTANFVSKNLRTLEIVDRDERRVVRLRQLLGQILEVRPAQVVKRGSLDVVMSNDERSLVSDVSSVLDLKRASVGLANYGEPSERKVRMFVAMPFKDDYSDEYDIAITEAAQYANIVCERIDKEAYVGDVMNQVRRRIASYHGMLALLNDANPNVFLEIGYAWAKDKPTVLMAKKGQSLPFDISGQKCIVYTSINELRTRLKAELKALVDNGTLVSG